MPTMPTFPLELNAAADAIAVVQNQSKTRDVRRFRLRPGVAIPPEIFDVEDRGKWVTDGQARLVVRGLQPGWDLVSML